MIDKILMNGSTYTYILSLMGKTSMKIVTVRVKTSLVHTSDFAQLVVHKILLECYTKLKFSVMIK